MWISSLSVLQFQISRGVRRRHKNQSLKKETICKRKTNYADSCVLSSTSSTQQFNAEPYQGGKKSCISHPRAIPSHIWHLESARLETKDRGWRGGKNSLHSRQTETDGTARKVCGKTLGVHVGDICGSTLCFLRTVAAAAWSSGWHPHVCVQGDRCILT